MSTFFITGEQRSGTTLLSVVLSRHSEIYIDGFAIGLRLVGCFTNYSIVLPYNASRNFHELQSWLIENDYKGRMASLIDYENLGKFPNAQLAIQDGIDRRLAENGKKVFGDKSPGTQHCMPELLALMPKARFIHVVRDARAVSYSQSSRTGKHLSLVAQDWVDTNVKGLTNQAWVGKETYLIVKYEDLVSEPEKTTRIICDFLNISFEPAMIADKTAEYEPDDYVLPSFEKSKIDHYRKHLSEKQLYKIEEIAAPIMKRFGYELSTSAERIPHKQLSVRKRIWLNQMDSVKRLFVSKIKGMQNRKVVDIHISLYVRLKHFAFELGRDFLSDKAFKRLSRRRWVREVYMDR